MKLLRSSFKEFILLLVVTVSTFLKLYNIEKVEFKYDQQFAYDVIKKCDIGNLNSDTLKSLFINSSSGLPQGPLHFFVECFSGVVGFENYINFLQVKIVVSQILIIIIYLNIKKTISAESAIATIVFILLNPYLIISSRNISAVYNYEFFATIFIFLLLRRNSSKNISFLYGFISSLSFAIYFPFLIYTTVINVVLLVKDRYKNIKTLSLGYISGIIGNIFLFLPVINEIKLENISGLTSWGVSSFWRISVQFLSGNSLENKINNTTDLNILNNQYPLYNIFHDINLIVILLLLVLCLIKLIKKIQIDKLDDFDLIFISIITIAGIIFTIIDRPLYPHYYFLFGIFSYLFLFKDIKNLKVLFLVCVVYSFSSIFIVLNFHNFISLNAGAINSDYGKTYESCGKIVKDARECRGQ